MNKRYIALEGLDGAGTTTQALMLAKHLKNEPTVLTKEPSELPTGDLIRQLIRHDLYPESYPYLFAADRAAHLETIVKPSLRRGHRIISDRCVASSLAYQGATMGVSEVADLNTHFILPDVIVFLEVPVEEAMKRVSLRGEALDVFEKKERMMKAISYYDSALLFLQSRDVTILKIDGTQTKEAVHRQIVAQLGLSWGAK